MEKFSIRQLYCLLVSDMGKKIFDFYDDICRIAVRVVKRAIILFALGIMINSIGGNNDFRTFRIPGMLTLI